jgi:hypothetical protein
MLISFGNTGQFGNAYLASAHRVAHALEYGYRLQCNDLGHYVDFMRPGSGRITFGGRRALDAGVAWGRISGRLIRSGCLHLGPLWLVGDRKKSLPVDAATFTRAVTRGVVVHNGWSFRDRGLLTKQAAEVRSILRLKEQYENAADERLQALRGGCRKVIGVHVRGGDYKTHRGGRFYFDQEVYRRLASEAVAASGEDPEGVLVVGLSNEKLDWPTSLGGARVVTPSGTWWEDLLCLAHCDLIIGPPSTFSGSASFMGNGRWFQIKDAEAAFDADQARTYLETGIQI